MAHGCTVGGATNDKSQIQLDFDTGVGEPRSPAAEMPGGKQRPLMDGGLLRSLATGGSPSENWGDQICTSRSPVQHGAQGPSVLCAANDRQRGHSDRDPRCRRRARTSSRSARRPSETNHARQRQQPIREQDQPGAKWDTHLQITSSPK